MRDIDKQWRGSRLAVVVAGVIPAAASFAFGAQAQEQGGALATLGLSFESQYTENDPDEDESNFTTALSFQLSSVTDAQSFVLSANGNLVLDKDGFDFESPSVVLDYTRQNRVTAFDVELAYSVVDVDGETDVIDPVTGVLIDLEEDDGTRETVTVDVGLETGRDALFGTEMRISYTDRSYSGTSDPDLTDLESWRLSTELRFDVDPRISLRSSASYRLTHEDDNLNTENRVIRFGLGGTFLIDRLWSASADLNYDIFETEETRLGGSDVTREEGLGFSLAGTRQFRDGTLGLSLAREVSDVGAEDSLGIFRNRELANGSELAWSVGIVSFPNGETSPIVSASYSRPTPRGGFFVGLDQTTAVNGDDESVVRTAVDLGFDQEINAQSGWSLSGSWTSIEIVGDDAQDRSRAELGVAYNYALTRDWDLSTSLSHQVTSEEGDDDESATTFSISLERSFSFRP